MSTPAELHVVLGSTGGIGAAVVAELLSAGKRVRAVSRSGTGTPGAAAVHADVATAEGARQACAGAAVVYHCAQPPYREWTAQFPAMTDAVLHGAASAGARLVFADNLYMYGAHSSSLTEDLPYAATGPKGKIRAQMAQALLAAHRRGDADVVLGRASNYYGPGGTQTVAGPRVFGAAVTGRKAQLIGRLDQPHTYSYLPDIARALRTLGQHPEASGRAWHLPTAEPLTGQQFLDLVVDAAGTSASTGATSASMIRLAGLFSPSIRELNETMPTFTTPHISDASAYQQAFGPFVPTPHRDAVATTVDWYRTHHPRHT